MRSMIREGLRRFIAPEAPRYAKGWRNATVIAISSQKGGVGKTTTAVSLAAALARYYELTTLVIDLDAQGHIERSLKRHVSGHGNHLSSILLSQGGPEVLDAVVKTDIERLHITGADRALSEAEGLMSTKIGKEFLLRDALKVTRTHYDMILFDCPPNLGNLTVNALVAADYVLIPCDASPLAIQGVTEIVRTMATINGRLNQKLDLLGVVLTRLDGRNIKVNEAVKGDLSRDFGDLIFDRAIGINTTLSKAQFEGQTIFEFDNECRAAKHYQELAGEVLQRLNGIGRPN